MIQGQKFSIIIKNIKTGDIICSYELKTFAKHKSGVLKFFMSPNSSLYERLVVFSMMMVVSNTQCY